MSIVSWILLGLFAGFIGSKLVNKSGEGMLLDIALGIVGAVIGGRIGGAHGLDVMAMFSVAGALCGRGVAAVWAPADAMAPPSAAIAELFRKSRRLWQDMIRSRQVVWRGSSGMGVAATVGYALA